MIGRVAGLLLEKAPPRILVDVQGVGYELEVPMSTFYQLGALGAPVALLTHFVVREDAQLLFGFLTDAERRTFRELVKVSGVGPRTALAVLSGLSTEELAQAVVQQSTARLVKVPGIGKKTAERLLLELKGKLEPVGQPLPALAHDSQADVLQALLALGYSEKEAAAALKSMPADLGVSDGIKYAHGKKRWSGPSGPRS
jgi:Holliday junction DNA helicase RuvA